MLNFMENHDEQRIASQFFAGDAEKGFPAMAVSTLMNTSPIMVYAGQELGENAHEAEGFSGFDGRTTIFDYWKVETLCRLQSSDYGLQIGENVIFDLYRRLLSIANREVVAEGKFYDLMWLNQRNPQFDSFRQYAFVRYTDKEALFVVANFAGEERDVRVNLTRHLFEAMGREAFGKVVAEDMMSGDKAELNFSADEPVEVVLKPYQVCAYSVLL
jgi:glycosidase